MIIKLVPNKFFVGEWRDWFAWHPVIIEDDDNNRYFVWFSTVQIKEDRIGPVTTNTEYRLKPILQGDA